MQTCLGKFFKPVDGSKKVELHQYLFEKEHADRGKRLREEEEKELAGIQEVVNRDYERLESKEKERRLNALKEQKAREKKAASRAEGCLIVDGLWLGGRLAAQNWEFLEHNRISCVLNVTSDVTSYYENQEAPTGETFLYRRVQVEDSEKSDLKQHFAESSSWIAEQLAAGRSVLVHCREGLSRSPSIVIAHLMQHNQLCLKDALSLVEERNAILRINEGFLRQLAELEDDLFGAQTTSLFDSKSRVSEPACYDDMTPQEKMEWEAKQAKKNRKKPLTLQQFIEFKSKEIRAKREQQQQQQQQQQQEQPLQEQQGKQSE